MTESRARPRVGIDDVARSAGVSRQTVSNVLNDRGRVGVVTRARVLSSVGELGYRPHGAARSLRSRRTRTLAHPAPASELRPGNVIMAQFLQALVAAAGEAGYQVLSVPVAPEDTVALAGLVASGVADAFVLADVDPRDPRVRLLAARGVPFAAFGRTGPGQPQNWVDLDNTAGMALVVGHLLSHGHTRVAYLGYDGPGYWDDEREDGFRAAMAEGGVRVRDALVSRTRDETAHAVIRTLLSRRPAPTAVVTGSDALAASVYSVAATRGLRIGRDLAVTGFDGSALHRTLVPSLTTAAIPLREVATALVARARREIDGPSGDPGTVIEVGLLVGGSTGSRSGGGNGPRGRRRRSSAGPAA